MAATGAEVPTFFTPGAMVPTSLQKGDWRLPQAPTGSPPRILPQRPAQQGSEGELRLPQAPIVSPPESYPRGLLRLRGILVISFALWEGCSTGPIIDRRPCLGMTLQKAGPSLGSPGASGLACLCASVAGPPWDPAKPHKRDRTVAAVCAPNSWLPKWSITSRSDCLTAQPC